MYKVIIKLIILSCIVFTSCRNINHDFQNFIESIGNKQVDLDNIEFIVVIPEAGCSGCISYMEDFYLQNNKVKSLFFVFSNIVSQKMLKSKIKINESNTLLDIDNKIMDCYPSDKKIYPCVLELDNGFIKNIYYQFPEENGLSIVKQKLNLQ